MLFLFLLIKMNYNLIHLLDVLIFSLTAGNTFEVYVTFPLNSIVWVKENFLLSIEEDISPKNIKIGGKTM